MIIIIILILGGFMGWPPLCLDPSSAHDDEHQFGFNLMNMTTGGGTGTCMLTAVNNEV